MSDDEIREQTADRAPSTCDCCYQAWLNGSNDFAPECVSGCRHAYQMWRYGEIIDEEKP